MEMLLSARDLSGVAGHFPHQFGHLFFLADPRDIGLRNHPDAAAAVVDHRHAPHLMLLHRRQDLVERRVLGDGDDAAGHAVFGWVGRRILTFGNDTAYDVAIGDDADDLLSCIDNRDFTAVVLNHEPRDPIERRVWCTQCGIYRHHISCELGHSTSSVPKAKASARRGPAGGGPAVWRPVSDTCLTGV